MSALDGKNFTIRIPKVALRSFLTVRFGLVILAVLFGLAFTYWYKALRPFLWIPARVETYSIAVGSDLAGRIVEMGPEEGGAVRKGQLLFALDRELISAEQKQTRDAVEGLRDVVRSQKMRMEKAMNEYLALSGEEEIGLDHAPAIAKQLEILEDAQAKTEESAKSLAIEEQKLSVLDVQLKKMSFSAPFDGIVLKRAKHPGAVIAFGEEIYLLSDPSRTWIEAQVPEAEIGRIAVGSEARISLPAYPKKEWKGKVVWIGPATASRAGSGAVFSKEIETIPVKISIEPLDRAIKPGLSAQVGLKIY